MLLLLAIVAPWADVGTFAKSASTFSHLRLRGGAEQDSSLVDSLSSLKEVLKELESKVKTGPAPASAPSSVEASPVLVDPEVGMLVRVRPDVKDPKFDWGAASPSSVGRLVFYHEERCVVDFPTHVGWNGLLTELERVDAQPADEETAEEPPSLVGARVRLRPGAAAPEGGWGTAGPPSEAEAANSSSWVGEVTSVHEQALGGAEVTVSFPEGVSWMGALSDVDLVEPEPKSAVAGVSEDPRASGGGGSERDGSAQTARGELWERSRDGARPHPLFSSFGSFSASTPSAGGANLRRPPRLSIPPSRMPGVPAPTWLGWTLGATFAQLAKRPGKSTSPLSRRAGQDPSINMGVTNPTSGGGVGEPSSGSADGARMHESSEDGLHLARGGGLFASVLVQTMRLLSPALYFASLLGLLLSAISMVLDQPVASLIDSSLHSLPGVLHAMGFLPGTVPPEGVVVPPLVRSLLLVPLRMPSTMLLSFFLYLLCVPGFDVLVRARTGFEHGFRAVASGGTSNAPGGGDSDERLASVLATWGRVISVVRAARFAAFGIVALALVDRLPEMVKAGAPLATQVPTIEATPALRGLLL